MTTADSGTDQAMVGNSLWWLASLLIIPGLIAVAFAMAWLEEHLTNRLVADEVTAAWTSIATPEDLEEAIARHAARIAPSRAGRVNR
jgi:hypothetical protein